MAPGSTAPELSLTVPEIVPEPGTVCPETCHVSNSVAVATESARKVFFNLVRNIESHRREIGLVVFGLHRNSQRVRSIRQGSCIE